MSNNLFNSLTMNCWTLGWLCALGKQPLIFHHGIKGLWRGDKCSDHNACVLVCFLLAPIEALYVMMCFCCIFEKKMTGGDSGEQTFRPVEHSCIDSWHPVMYHVFLNLLIFQTVYGKTQFEATHWHTGATWEDKSHSASTSRTDLPTTVILILQPTGRQ